MHLEIVSIVVLIVTGFMIARSYGLTNWLNPFVLFWLFHCIFMYAGLFYRQLYSGYVEIEPATFIMIWLGIFFSTLGAVSVYYFKRGVAEDQYDIANAPQNNSPELQKILIKIFFIVGASIALFYFALAGTIPFLADDADNFRIEARMGKGFLVLLAIAFIKYAVYRRAILSTSGNGKLVGIFIMITLGAAVIIGMGNRAPALELILFSFAIIALVRGIKMSMAKIAPIGLASLGFMAFLGIVRQGLSLSGLMVGFQMLWRPFANIQNLQWIYNAFPSQLPFLKGYGYIIDAAVVMPGYSPNFGTWFKEAMDLDFSGGSVTVSYLGEIFANFGWLGIIPIAFLYGFGLSYLYYRFTPKKNYNNLIILVILATTLKGIVSSGIISVLLYDTLVLFLIHFLFIGSQWVAGKVLCSAK
jgi:oligosaccharide repeat unit polymerase